MNHIDTLLLLALPASGKSEIRRYLAHVDPEVAARDFRIGPTVQLDDYPYVQLMRLIDRESVAARGSGVFFHPESEVLLEPRDWGTLARLLEQDYEALGSPGATVGGATRHFLERLDRARGAVGAAAVTDGLSGTLIDAIAASLDEEIGGFFDGLAVELSRYDDTSTVVVEFARGGRADSTFPLPPPHGYGYTLQNLGDEMPARGSILYVWVTPEESRRRNVERAGPGPEEAASVLHHRVPDTVMHFSYGTDDMLWLIEAGDGDVVVRSDGSTHRMPAAVLDNRSDHTTFLRSEPDEWRPADVAALHRELKEAFNVLADG
jgi:hypothetical protein